MSVNFNNAQFETSFGTINQFNNEEDIIEIAFAGRSNVGKSSLLNKLMSRKGLAKVSSSPGKTATINFYRLEEDFRLVDLPGYGYAKVSKTEKNKWSDLISGYFALDRNLILTVLLIDSRHSPTKDDMNMIEFIAETETPAMIAFTKTDKLSKRQLEERKKDFDEKIFSEYDMFSIYTSSQTGEGIDELKETISELVDMNREDI